MLRQTGSPQEWSDFDVAFSKRRNCSDASIAHCKARHPTKLPPRGTSRLGLRSGQSAVRACSESNAAPWLFRHGLADLRRRFLAGLRHRFGDCRKSCARGRVCGTLVLLRTGQSQRNQDLMSFFDVVAILRHAVKFSSESPLESRVCAVPAHFPKVSIGLARCHRD
jgi:hypothetical protein